MSDVTVIVSDEMLEEAAHCLKIMAHPVRLKLVSILMNGQYCVNELGGMCGCLPNQACEHLRLMKSCGFLTSHRVGKQVFYEIASPRLPKLLECIASTCKSY